MKAIEIIPVPVSDQEKSKEFYVDKLGFHIIFEGDSPEGKWIQLSIADDTTSISLIARETHAKAASTKGVIIVTDNISEDVERLRAKGIKAEDIREFPHGKVSSFSDPDGNRWILRQAPSYNQQHMEKIQMQPYRPR